MKNILTESEIQLIQAARKGKVAAFRQLVDRYADPIRKTVIGLLGPTAEAEDVAQEVFIRLYRSLPDFREESGLGTYLHRIAVNLALDELKKRKNRLKLFQSTSTETEPADHELERLELQEVIQNALQQIEPEFRVVVSLRLIQGYSLKETADILELPVGTVASRLFRAQQKLRPLLKVLL